jgi:hypothetical protein
MKNIVKNSCILIVTLALFSSCVNDTYDSPKFGECVDPGLTKTKEVAQIYAVAINPVATPPSVIPNTPTYTTDDIVEGYVISSDEGGNFYQSMYIQPTDGSKGFNISAEMTNIYNSIPAGTKVFLKLKGLGFANPTSFGIGLIFGAPPTDKYAVDRLGALEVKNHLIPSCDPIKSEDDIVKKNLTIKQLTNPDNRYLNTLVEIDNVQFNDATAGLTYDTNRNDTFDSSTYITDGTTELAVRTSRYANFAGFKTPTGSGKISGVLTKYGTGFQIILRTERDVEMDKERKLSPSNPLGGTNLVFSGAFTEDFSSYNVGLTAFPKYINDYSVGKRYWAIKQFPSGTGNKYIEMSSYSGATSPGVVAKSYFMVPVDFTAANTFSFKKEARYYFGPVLKVYYVKSSNFTTTFLNAAKFTDITSSFNITYPAMDNSENAFTSSGVYNIPSDLTGTGYFVFEYSGGGTVTTTMQIDDIVIN